MGVVGKASLAAYDALPPAWEALLRGVRRTTVPTLASVARAAGDGRDGACSHLPRCDATQRRAVRCVAGGPFVPRGPPGTGKSATLATSCLALAATGRSVLVVGQEVAAARVVAAKVGGFWAGVGEWRPRRADVPRKLQVDCYKSVSSAPRTRPPCLQQLRGGGRPPACLQLIRTTPTRRVLQPGRRRRRTGASSSCAAGTRPRPPMAKHLRTHAEQAARRLTSHFGAAARRRRLARG